MTYCFSPRHTDSLPPGHTGPGCTPWVCRSTCSRPCRGCRRGCAVTSPRGWPPHTSPGRHRPPATAGSWCQHRDCTWISWSPWNWEHRTGSARMREYLISSSHYRIYEWVPIIRLFQKFYVSKFLSLINNANKERIHNFQRFISITYRVTTNKYHYTDPYFTNYK